MNPEAEASGPSHRQHGLRARTRGVSIVLQTTGEIPMNAKLTAYRIMLFLTALGVLTWSGTASADDPQTSFTAWGTSTVTSPGEPFGDPLIAIIDGNSDPFGPFTGVFESNLVGSDEVAPVGVGIATLKFNDGTLVTEIPNELGPDGDGHGAWRVIDGDGIFEGVSGYGTLVDEVMGFTGDGLPIFMFEFEGKLSKFDE
jgi:hypothetical protein